MENHKDAGDSAISGKDVSIHTLSAKEQKLAAALKRNLQRRKAATRDNVPQTDA